MRIWHRLMQFLQNLQGKTLRAYRYSTLRKLLHWARGKTVHWSVYIAVSSLVMVSLLGFHNYLNSFYYVVKVGEEEVGLVSSADEIEEFIAVLTDQCSELFGMAVEPGEAITLTHEYRPGGTDDSCLVKEALRQRIVLVADVIMLTVDGVPVVPVATEDCVEAVIDGLIASYVSEANKDELLEVTLVEDICGEPYSISPEMVYSPEEVSSLLLAPEIGEREISLLSRGPTTAGGNDEADLLTQRPFPVIHVITKHKVTTEERIPFSTSYTYTSALWSVQSRITTPGKEGRRQVVYEVTRENGKEVSRQKVSDNVLVAPVTQVIERGTSRVPAMGTGQFVWPVEGGGRLTQGFKGWSHAGVDISYASWEKRHNTRVLAADSGVVVETGSKWPQGNYIVIFHGDYFTAYLHLQRSLVTTGATVSRGQSIGIMGNTGRTYGMDGIHLHFEVRANDGTGIWQHWRQHAPVDPLRFFPLR